MKNRSKLLIASLFAGLSLGVLSGVKFATDDIPPLQANAESAWKLLTSSTKSIGTGYYYINSNITIKNTSAGGNGLTIDAKSTASIYIPKGYTLTCQGGDGSNATGGGAGIYLPSGSSLYLYGGGNVISKGGNAGNGTNGSSGGYGTFNTTNKTYTSGTGGAGGAGGGGAGAGIGTSGGKGGAGGNQSAAISGAYNADHHPGTAGQAGSAGSTAADTGSLYVDKLITLTATGGKAGTAGGSGGAAGKTLYDKGTKWDNNHTAGGGAGGGGGGAGYAANNIGRGGPGGGGGGAGGSGYLVYKINNSVGGYYYTEAFGGSGGTGAFSGNAGSSSTSSTLYAYSDFSITTTGNRGVCSDYKDKGTAGGAGGGKGTSYSGKTYSNCSLASCKISYFDKGGVVFSGKHSDSVSEFDCTKGLTLDTPTKEYFTFKGYYLNSDCSSAVITRLEAFSYTNDVVLYTKWVKTLSDFAREFLDKTDGGIYCDKSKGLDKSIQDDLLASYNMVEDKSKFINAERIVGMTDGFEDDVIEAKSRYCYMVEELGIDDFLGLGIGPVNRSLGIKMNTLFGITEEDVPEVTTLGVLTIAGGISIGAYFLLKKKKFN